MLELRNKGFTSIGLRAGAGILNFEIMKLALELETYEKKTKRIEKQMDKLLEEVACARYLSSIK